MVLCAINYWMVNWIWLLKPIWVVWICVYPKHHFTTVGIPGWRSKMWLTNICRQLLEEIAEVVSAKPWARRDCESLILRAYIPTGKIDSGTMTRILSLCALGPLLKVDEVWMASSWQTRWKRVGIVRCFWGDQSSSHDSLRRDYENWVWVSAESSMELERRFEVRGAKWGGQINRWRKELS